MTTTVPDITITLHETQRRIVLNALYDKAAETDHYLSGYREDKTPGPLDTCCDKHRALFKDRSAQRDTLIQRKEQIVALIDLIGSSRPAATTADSER